MTRHERHHFDCSMFLALARTHLGKIALDSVQIYMVGLMRSTFTAFEKKIFSVWPLFFDFVLLQKIDLTHFYTMAILLMHFAFVPLLVHIRAFLIE